MNPRVVVKTLALCLPALLAGGCSFNVAQIPAPEAFAAPLPEVLDAYPDMRRVFHDEASDSRPGMARAEPFMAAWGEPVATSYSWWNLWPGNWLFLPQELWVWELEGKRIQCRIDHPIYEGFRATVCNCVELGNKAG